MSAAIFALEALNRVKKVHGNIRSKTQWQVHGSICRKQ